MRVVNVDDFEWNGRASVSLPLTGRGQGWGWRPGKFGEISSMIARHPREGLEEMSPTSNNTAIMGRARKLRRVLTDGERKLWSELRDFRRLYGIHIRRQAPIERFVVDFVIHEHSLIIEVDGEHHFTPDGLNRDVRRDNWLEAQGYRILRFNTGEVADCFDGCIEEILAALGVIRSTPTPDPSPQGGGGP